MANSVDPDQTAPEQSDLGLHCLPSLICPKTWIMVFKKKLIENELIDYKGQEITKIHLR